MAFFSLQEVVKRKEKAIYKEWIYFFIGGVL